MSTRGAPEGPGTAGATSTPAHRSGSRPALQDPAELAARTAVASQLSFVLSDARVEDEPLIWVNEEFCRLTGYAPAEVIGRNCRFLQGAGTDRRTVDQIKEDLHAGRTVSATALNYRRDGTPFWNHMVISPVRDETGTITHHLGIQTDATDQVLHERARAAELELLQQTSERLDLLSRVGDALAELQDLTDAAQAVADIATPALAKWGFVALLDDRGVARRVHVSVAAAAHRAAARQLEALDPGWLGVCAPQVLRALSTDRDDILLPEPVDVAAVRAGTSPAQLALLEQLGLGCVLVVPLWARDRVLGVLGFVHAQPRGLDARVVVTAAHLGRRAGLALDNVRLYRAQRQTALALQNRLLPRPTPVPGLDVSASYLPSDRQSEVGGDWFDALTLPDGSVGLTIGDVVGHDMVAAAAMGQVSSLLRAQAWTGAEPAQVIGALGGLLRHIDSPDVATCVYLRWQTRPGGAHLRYVNAGHPPPLLRLPDGTVRRLDARPMLPVGLDDGTRPVAQGDIDVPHGAVLVLYTDGLVERRDRHLRAGIDALADALAQAPTEGAEQIRDHLLGALVGDRLDDDVCLLVVRCP
ncbi:SpoIIE family protein phosphatase [Cellulomonas citrea]|uniref:SpoIIE family protein phosphatase n=1 Tax=Cellulomonas citrea TaxID=1909423 RepID=UPI0013585A58|nr:SpoIIE family protein phosphatase [Cellulomonas citrea]